jgi:rubrerythrin
MDLSNPVTLANLEAAFGGESMANRKYLFFADLAKQLGNAELARLFRDTAQQETEHAFAHFRLLHPELVVVDPTRLSPEQKQAILSRCLELAIEGETYEFTTMYPEFAAQARQERDGAAEAEFDALRLGLLRAADALLAEARRELPLGPWAESLAKGLVKPLRKSEAAPKTEGWGLALAGPDGGSWPST